MDKNGSPEWYEPDQDDSGLSNELSAYPDDVDLDDEIARARAAEAADFPPVDFVPTETPDEGPPDRSVDDAPDNLGRTLSDGGREPTDGTRKRSQNFLCTSRDSLVWSAAELVALQFGPLGPIAVKTLYLGQQIVTAFDGLADGEGFNLKMGFGLELLDGEGLLQGGVLPPGFQLIVSIRLGQRLEQRDGGVDFTPEIQFFEPWFEQIDIGEARKPPGSSATPSLSGVPTVYEADDNAPSDPWREWLAFLGRRAIDDLPAVLSQAPSLAFVMKLGPDQNIP